MHTCYVGKGFHILLKFGKVIKIMRDSSILSNRSEGSPARDISSLRALVREWGRI